MVDRKAYREALLTAAKKLEVNLSPERLEKTLAYVETLLEVNESLNLTRITAPSDLAIKHFEDSWTLLPVIDERAEAERARLLDIGSGAGFPGIPLALARPSLDVWLLESIEKKARFLEKVRAELGLNVTVLNGRAEELAHQPDYREAFDLVTARAVASLDILVELALPFVKKGGYFIAMRGQEEAIPSGVEPLGATLTEIRPLTLSGDLTRTLYVFLKVSGTPQKLPRTIKKMKKSPL